MAYQTPPRMASQHGLFAVEFAFCFIVILLMIMGTLEIARALYVYNTLQESTRRAAARAAVTDFTDKTALTAIQQDAVFRTTSGALWFGSPVTDANVTIDYMAQVRATSGALTLQAIAAANLPACPYRNRQICMSDPNDPGCVRFVRVRICAPSGDDSCPPMSYLMKIPVINATLLLPTSTTIVPAESLGFVTNPPSC